MRTSQRQRQSSVIDRLLAAPWRYDLVQALRVLERWLRRNGRTGDPLQYVRFRNSLSMSFPASQIEALSAASEQPITSGRALQAALDNDELKTITVTPAFLGFFGVNGMLPHFYTDDIAGQMHADKYEGTRAFFDIFYNRIMALYFQAACKHRVQHRIDEAGHAAIFPMQLALAGKRPARDGDGELSDIVGAHYAAMLRHRPVSAALIAAILNEYFALPVRVEQFVGAYDQLRPDELWKLGTQCATLGKGVILGTRVRERHTRVRVHIGPLSMTDYNRFLPAAPGAIELSRLLALFATPTIRFELCPILRAADIVPLKLGAPSGNRLGYDTVLATRTTQRDCAAFRFNTDR